MSKFAEKDQDGMVPISQIATGTPTGSKYVRDDGTPPSFSRRLEPWQSTSNGRRSSAYPLVASRSRLCFFSAS